MAKYVESYWKTPEENVRDERVNQNTIVCVPFDLFQGTQVTETRDEIMLYKMGW